ncbi:MAG TPA: hypothetical protein ENF73_00340 [Proteobacteria bacterium]|nr:hypothetical protein [Pseudomonadota bacterium]
MIKSLEVKNFKSIKHLKINCKRINLFIGEPNTGKSNILEAIGLFSLPFGELPDLVRLEDITDLFYDHDPANEVEVRADGDSYKITAESSSDYISIRMQIQGQSFLFSYRHQGEKINTPSLSPSQLGNMRIKFYRFKALRLFDDPYSHFLKPPDGKNLFTILYLKKEIRKFIGDMIRAFGFKLVLKPQEKKMELQKEVDDIAISHPYFLLSDTLQRTIFYIVAIETNKDSTLLFEEPESNAFPFYTKELAERIADDRSNQYFISTHNPYFLVPLMSKAPKNELGVFITYFEDYQTKVKPLEQEDIEEALDLEADIFFNLDRFLGKE